MYVPRVAETVAVQCSCHGDVSLPLQCDDGHSDIASLFKSTVRTPVDTENAIMFSLPYCAFLFLAVTLLRRCGALNPTVYPGMESKWSLVDELSRWNPYEPIEDIEVLPDYDFVVVGAGSAGALVANRLSEINHWKVLLIEAGQEATRIMDIPLVASLMQGSAINWDYKTVPMNDSCLGFEKNQCKIPRGKVMGGSSVLNYMIYTRGNRKDYDNWAKMGNTGWSYDEVLKYFKKSEAANLSCADEGYHGKDGMLPVTDIPFKTPIAKAFVNAASEIGMPVVDINGKSQIGVDYIQATLKKGKRCSANMAFLSPEVRNRPNLTVKKHSMVTRILLNNETKSAEGVEFVRYQRTYRVFVNKEVIVCGGAINSPQLLMLSGIGPRAHLDSLGLPVVKELPVGENLMDHVALGSLNVAINGNSSLILNRILADPNKMAEFLVRYTGPFTVPGGAEALAFADLARPGVADGHPDLELLLVSGQYASYDSSRRLYGFKPEVYNKMFKRGQTVEGFTVFPMVLRPRSRGRVRLTNVSPFLPPSIDPGYFAHEADLDVIVAGVRLFQRMLDTDAMRSIGARLPSTPMPGCEHHAFDSDEYWKCSARIVSFSIYHLSGTCKMAPAGDPTAVVDPRLRVHGVSKLRVVDASVMPEIPAGHTNAPTLMIAEKASDMIKEDWGGVPPYRTDSSAPVRG